MPETWGFSWPDRRDPASGPTGAQTERYRQFLEDELRDRSEKLALAEMSAGVGIWDIDVVAQTVRGTAQFFRLMGLPPSDKAIPLETVRALRIGEDREALLPGYVDTIAANRDAYEGEYRITRPDGAVRWIFGRGRVIRNAIGEPVRYTGVDIDVTDRKTAEAARRDSDARLQLALDAAGLAVWEVVDSKLRGSPELNRMMGFEPGHDISGEELRQRYVAGEYERMQEAGKRVVENHERYLQVEFRIRWPDQSVHWILLRAEIQFGPTGTPVGALGVAMDISERKTAEERQHLMMRELDHRVKNTLATVQAISHQTFRAAEDIPAATATFNARLGALANAHGVLTSSSWQSANIVELVASALQPFRDPERERFIVSGPSALLSPQLALTVAMTLHELCTNASKYGAFTSPMGKVALSWTVGGSPSRLNMRWVEQDGPPVTQPRKTGFGTRLITGGLTHAGDVRLEFAPDGVVCEIDIALELPAVRTANTAGP